MVFGMYRAENARSMEPGNGSSKAAVSPVAPAPIEAIMDFSHASAMVESALTLLARKGPDLFPAAPHGIKNVQHRRGDVGSP